MSAHQSPIFDSDYLLAEKQVTSALQYLHDLNIALESYRKRLPSQTIARLDRLDKERNSRKRLDVHNRDYEHARQAVRRDPYATAYDRWRVLFQQASSVEVPGQ